MHRNTFNKQLTHRSIRTLLLLAVNLPLLLALVVLLPLDYRREMDRAIAQKQASLDEEALTLYESLSYLINNSIQEEPAQRFIETICGCMQQSRSPGHRIAVRWNNRWLQAETHRCASPEVIRAMQQAAESSSRQIAVGDNTLVVGSFADDDIEVYVSDYATDIRHSVRHEILLHLGLLAALAIAAAMIVTVVLWRVVASPVKQLAITVSCIAEGAYGVRLKDFLSREMNALSTAIQQMSKTLSAHERDRHARLDRARRIQENLLPNDTTIPGLAVAHWFQPAETVAGDYFDLIRLPDDTWLVCVADVSGHGVAAAMGAVMLKTLMIYAAERHQEPRTILRCINERLAALLSDELITMFLARWDPESHQLEYASAGHEPGLLLSPGGKVRKLLATGLPLGIGRTADWETEVVDFSPSQRLLLITDGLVEVSDPDGKLFGRKRLADVACSCGAQLPDEAVQALRDEIARHQGTTSRTDDITMLLIDSTCNLSSNNSDSQDKGYNAATDEATT